MYIYMCVCVYIYNGILLSHRKEQHFAICGNMDGLGGHYAKQNKSDKDKWYHLKVESKKTTNEQM